MSSRVLADLPGMGEAACWLDVQPFLPLDDSLVEGSGKVWREFVESEVKGIAACQLVQCELTSYGVIQGERYLMFAAVELDVRRVSWRAEFPAGGPHKLMPAALRYLAGFDTPVLATASMLLPDLRQAALAAYQRRVQAQVRAIRHSLTAIEEAILRPPPSWSAAA